MDKLPDYYVVFGFISCRNVESDKIEFNQKVRNMLRDGWTFHGDTKMSVGHNSVQMSQAFVKMVSA